MILRAVLALGLLLAPLSAAAFDTFRFESEVSLDDMQARIKRDMAAGMPRDEVRAVFVQQGGATLKVHATRPEVEKYVYDIDLCSYYVWRWNISADYGADGRLKQIFVNGLPQLGHASPPKMAAKGPFLMLSRARPQAFKGESSLKAIINKDGMILTGVGPTRSDPLDMGRAFPYAGEVWRSIFDGDEADRIVPYGGDCAAVDAKYDQLKAAAAGPPKLASPSPK